MKLKLLITSILLTSMVGWFADWPIILTLLSLISFYFLFELILGVINIQTNYFVDSVNTLDQGQASSRSSNTPKRICLSFDDGIHSVNTPIILDMLKEQQIKAMFFIIGNHIPGNEAILRRMHNEGHVIGNHSYSHNFWFDMKSANDMIEDIQKLNELILKETGLKPVYFRPPYGVTNPNVAKAIRKTGMQSTGWSVRSMDTVAKSGINLLDRLKSRTHNGAIILLHDRCEPTLEILTEYIVFCKAEGYTFETLNHESN